MRFSALVVALVTASLTSRVLVSAQSLADVAKREQERRKAVKDSGKVYTNKDLKPAPEPAAPAPAPASTDSASASGKESAGKAAEKGKAEEKAAEKAEEKNQDSKEPVRNQAYWSGRMKGLQAALQRDQLYAEALQSRINALTTDFVNRDDPAQRSVIANDRDKALAELERLKKTIVEDKAAIAELEEEARRAGVLPGWLR